MINKIFNENCLDTIARMPDSFLDLVVTSPPYWNLRDYGHAEQLGLEDSFQEYLDNLFNIFQQLRPKIKDTGAAWINLGDTYSTVSGTMGSGKGDPKHVDGANKVMDFKQSQTKLKSKTLIGIPDRFKIMMINAGWICRNDIIWHKPNAMPSSASDRFTVDYERFFFFTKNTKYYFEQQFDPYSNEEEVAYRKQLRMGKDYNLKAPYKKNAPYTKTPEKNAESFGSPRARNHREGGYKETHNPNGKNKRAVWSINTKPDSCAHFAMFPDKLIEIPIKACCPEGGVAYDPFMGSGKTAKKCIELNRNYIGSEISTENCAIINKRIDEATRQGKLF